MLDSGRQSPFDERPQGVLLLVDAVSGGQETVMRGFVRELRIAPDGRHVAFFRQADVVRPQAHRELESMRESQRLAIVTAQGEVVAGGVEGIEEPVSTSLRWSPDSTEVALIGRHGASRESPRAVLRYRLADGRVQPLTEASLEPTSAIWAAGGHMLTFAIPAKGATEEATQRGDWWLVGDDHEPRRLTADLSAVPTQLLPPRGPGGLRRPGRRRHTPALDLRWSLRHPDRGVRAADHVARLARLGSVR